ncbi:MAG: site-2 protease family protein [Phycisphaerales bacterium JB047]
MFDLPGPAGTFANFLVIAAGFGFIIFIHELGHFLAAKWAGIRVLAFSIGFGQIACSYRKGVGFRRGSSEREYLKRAKGLSTEQTQELHKEISPTEYRLSWLPLGGYVKMLGQEDLNPDATSSEPDSYQNCSVPKRMVVICAGVVMNVISAAILFIIVFNAGLKVFPAKAGYIVPDGPAAMAAAVDRDDIAPGLQRGDRITQINGKEMYSFEHIMPEIAMSRKGTPVSIVVEREGVNEPIEFSALPVKNPMTGLLGIQIDPPITTQIKTTDDPELMRQISMFAGEFGLAMLEPEDRLLEIDGQPMRSPFDLIDKAEQSGGNPFTVTIERAGNTLTSQVSPVRELQLGQISTADGDMAIAHTLGLSGVMMVNPNASPEDTKQGLIPGDIFARVGDKAFPSVDEGIAIVKANTGKPLSLEVLRGDAQSGYERVSLEVQVTGQGTVGFYPAMSTGHASFVHKPNKIAPIVERGEAEEADANLKHLDTPAMALIEYPGSRIARIGGTPISTLRDVAGAIVDATESAYASGAVSFTVPVTLQLPLPVQPDGSIPTTTSDWTLSRADIDSLRELGWTLPGGNAISQLFVPEQVIDRSPSPVAAIERGIAESRRVMMQTYLTFLRLFQGSVQVQHLKGPVGIAHLGTQIASQGFIWVLFFMALISINLAVINFLPLPIVDGGQFLMLCYEGLRGRPVPIVIQNVATMAGLLLIGCVFLFVTFNDIKNILGV